MFQKLDTEIVKNVDPEKRYEIKLEKVNKQLAILNKHCHLTGDKSTDIQHAYEAKMDCIALNASLDSFTALPCFDEEYTSVNADSGIVRIEYFEGGIYHYVLRYLVPHLTRINATTDKVKYRFNKDGVYSSYAKGVFRYEKDIGFRMFEDTILVAFLNLYDEKETIPDADNLDYKPFIDAAVKQVLVPDDSLRWVQLLSMAGKDRISHTEVFAGKPESVLSYLYR